MLVVYHYYNHQRHHQGIDGEIPAQRYDENKKLTEKPQVKQSSKVPYIKYIYYICGANRGEYYRAGGDNREGVGVVN